MDAGQGTRTPLVLVVDDQEANVRLVGSALTDGGFDVMPALNGGQALARVEADPPDVVLLDMRMPGMGGFEVLEKLKQDPKNAAIPVIFVTAAHEREYVVQALEAGAVDYITKPFVAEELVARVRAHAELKIARDRLTRAIREREELNSVVAHDLKNPLFNISLNASMLAEAAGDADKVRRIASGIEASAKKAMGFVEHYLERRADIELRRGYEPRVCDPAQLVALACEDFAPALERREQRLEIGLDGAPRILADPEAFAVVLRNLVSNASKYGPEGGSIEVRAQRGKPGHLGIAVADRGPGITPAQRRQLFQRFVRGGQAPASGESSSGLGLAHAMQEAQWMGGELWHEPREGGGSVFVLELPLAATD